MGLPKYESDPDAPSLNDEMFDALSDPSGRSETPFQSELDCQSGSTMVFREIFSEIKLNFSSTMLTKPNCIVGTPWDLLSHPGAACILSQGDALFGFACRTVTELTPEDLQMMEPIVNISGFTNEVRENNVPHILVDETESLAPFTFILCKAMYGLPGLSLSDITAELVSSFEYQRACQPYTVTILETDAPQTFRFTKPIIPYVYSITVQMRCTEFNDRETRRAFQQIEGVTPDKLLLLERTKRDINRVDQTAKAKSVLLYYAIPGGVLVSHLTVVANTSIPRVAAKLIHRFGNRGGKETAEVLHLTRGFFASRKQ